MLSDSNHVAGGIRAAHVARGDDVAHCSLGAKPERQGRGAESGGKDNGENGGQDVAVDTEFVDGDDGHDQHD